jgi:hypothetical protein
MPGWRFTIRANPNMFLNRCDFRILERDGRAGLDQRKIPRLASPPKASRQELTIRVILRTAPLPRLAAFIPSTCADSNFLHGVLSVIRRWQEPRLAKNRGGVWDFDGRFEDNQLLPRAALPLSVIWLATPVVDFRFSAGTEKGGAATLICFCFVLQNLIVASKA